MLLDRPACYTDRRRHAAQLLALFARIIKTMAHSPHSRLAARLPIPLVVVSLFCAMLGLHLYQEGWFGRALAEPNGHDIDASGVLQAFFTTPSLKYPDQDWQRPPSPLLEAVLKDIDAAHTQIEVASFDFDIKELTQALLRARRRGVAIRLVVDSENLLTPEVAQQAGQLQRAGIGVRFDRREPFMHDKFLVIDGALTWLGSWNLTTNDTWRNNNNMLRFANAQLAADYANEFEQMFAGRFGTSKRSATPYPQVRVGSSRVAVYFSPEDGVAAYVLERLADSKHSIYFMTFSYTEDKISDAMIARRKAGLEVRGVFESQNAHGSGADFSRLRQGGVNVLEDGNCYILHHKVIIIDERTVITGSYNFTGSAERDNDENLVIVDDPALARLYLEEFARVYAQAEVPARCQ